VGRPRLHDERTRAALLEAAEAIVAERGIDALSVRTVADGVGASTRAVYSVFGSKEALVRGLAHRAFELLMQAVDAIPETGDPGLDLSQAMVRGFRRFALEHRDLFRLAFVWSPVQPNQEVLDMSAEALTRLVHRIERAQSAGVLPSGNVKEATAELHAMCLGLATLELCGMLPNDQEERVWVDSVGDLLAGLQKRASAAGELGVR
jgi:AcrR family transcriptional regulator